MPSIHVHLFAGRTLEQKRAYAAALTEATVRVLGGSAESVDIVFTDVARHDWATAGVLWSDRQSSAAAPAAPASTTSAASSSAFAAAASPPGKPPAPSSGDPAVPIPTPS